MLQRGYNYLNIMSIFKTVYRALFPKDNSPIWKQFADKHNGKYIYNLGDNVIFFHKGFKILFGIHTHYTVVGSSCYESDFFRVMVEFISPDNLQLKILPQDLVENIGKLFGTKEIEIGDESFDRRFMIKGNDEVKAQLILGNKVVREKLTELRDKLIRLEVTDKEGVFQETVREGNSMLYFLSKEKIKYPEQLDYFKELITSFLDQLEKYHSAKALNNPEVN